MSPAVKWGVLALIVAFGIWYFAFGREKSIPVGVVVADVVNAPMSGNEAETVVRRMKETGTVETKGDVLDVTFPAALWPQLRAGQLAAAQRYARAVEMTEGKGRKIAFRDPAGVLYAKADAAGVMLVK
jgi:hypothetical protein